MTAILARLAAEADRAEVVVNAKTQGFWQGLLSGDTGGGERTYIATVKDILIPALQRGRARAAPEEKNAQEWLDNAHYAEQSLAQVQGYAAQGTVDQILKDTIVQTGTDVKSAAAAVAPYAAFGGG